jgi:chromosome segregation ATPase
MTALEVESADRDELMKMTESQLSDALEKVEGLGGENQDLRQSLEQVMAERDQQAVRARDVTGRLGSLATSLASMMDRQEMLMQSHNEKDAQLMEASLACREYLTKLFEIEQDFMEQVMSPQDQVPLYEEQLKEMDAISADIEAITTTA